MRRGHEMRPPSPNLNAARNLIHGRNGPEKPTPNPIGPPSETCPLDEYYSYEHSVD